MSDRQKELKTAYKLNPPPMGVCQLKNQINGKIFITSSTNLTGRKNSMLFQLQLKSHPNKELQREYNQYGPDAFHFEILQILKTEDFLETKRREALAELEDEWLDKLKPYDDKGYNKPKKKAGSL